MPTTKHHANTTEAENVTKPITAEIGQGTANALADAAEKSDVEITELRQRVDPIAGNEVDITIPLDEDESVPASLKSLLNEWGYEEAAANKLGVDEYHSVQYRYVEA